MINARLKKLFIIVLCKYVYISKVFFLLELKKYWEQIYIQKLFMELPHRIIKRQFWYLKSLSCIQKQTTRVFCCPWQPMQPLMVVEIGNVRNVATLPSENQMLGNILYEGMLIRRLPVPLVKKVFQICLIIISIVNLNVIKYI